MVSKRGGGGKCLVSRTLERTSPRGSRVWDETRPRGAGGGAQKQKSLTVTGAGLLLWEQLGSESPRSLRRRLPSV